MHLKSKTILLSMPACVILALSSCAAPANDPSLTPAENQIRQRAAQFDNTVGEGAGAGAVVGAVVGGLLSKNHIAGAALGAAAGAAVGGGLGYMVANRNQAQGQSEDQYHKAIAQADQTAQQSAQDAAAAEQETAQVQSQLAELNRRYQAKQLDAEGYQSGINALRRRDHDLAQVATSYEAKAKAMAIYSSGRPNPSLTADAQATSEAAARMRASEIALSNALGATPSVPAPIGAGA